MIISTLKFKLGCLKKSNSRSPQASRLRSHGYLVFTVILVALIFTYTNGFHDTANSIATVVGTKVLTPRQAIILATVTNLLGAHDRRGRRQNHRLRPRGHDRQIHSAGLRLKCSSAP